MPNYRRPRIPGGSYFVTQVTYKREPWLCSVIGRKALREAIAHIRIKYPFSIEAFVLLPEHFHGVWTLPPRDQNFSVRLRLIKTYVTKRYGQTLGINRAVSRSCQKRGAGNLWQRRCWEHLIRDQRDFALHCDYIHYNPVRHGLCGTSHDWPFSSIHRFMDEGIYPLNWGWEGVPEKSQGIWDE
ncbi:MAG: transposase [Leptolyngbyaceae cyanobacterium MO_188.B28]|nr:transposase [Leptolyngbyaceae cyanobacterium MO_188.B28]